MNTQKEILKEIIDKLTRQDFKAVYAAPLYEKLGNEKDPLLKGVIQEKINSILLTDETKGIVALDEVCQVAEDLGYGLVFNQDGNSYLYNKNYWEPMTELDLKQFLSQVLQKMGTDKYTAKNVKVVGRVWEQARFSLYRSMQPDREKTKINLLNTTLTIDGKGNVKEEPHRAEDYFFYVLPYDYDPKAACPLFRKFLDEVLPDAEIQMVLQEFVGSCLCPSLKLEKVLCCVGTGFNGKSVFFEVIMSLLGSENVTTYNISSLCNENGYTRAMIKNKLLNYSSDFNGKIANNGTFKQLASGEPSEARRLYRDPEIIKDYARLAFNCNSIPLSTDTSYGFRRRLLIIPFEQKISKDKADPDLPKKLCGELPGILVWAIEGLQRLITNGKKLSHSAAIEALEQEYKESIDSVIIYLGNKQYQPDSQQQEGLKKLYAEYKDYCNQNKLTAETMANFKQKLKDEGYPVEEKGKKGVKIGISKPVPVFEGIDLSFPRFNSNNLNFPPSPSPKEGVKGVEGVN